MAMHSLDLKEASGLMSARYGSAAMRDEVQSKIEKFESLDAAEQKSIAGMIRRKAISIVDDYQRNRLIEIAGKMDEHVAASLAPDEPAPPSDELADDELPADDA